jgi:DNA-binding MarR family transcriptional regulator
MTGVVGFLVNLLGDQLRQVTGEHLQPLQVHPRQAGLLLVLQCEPDMQQQELGEALGMDRTTVMQLVTALVDDGIVQRLRDPDDGRAYRVSLTPKGRRVAKRAVAAISVAQREVLGGLSAAEERTLRRLLVKALTASAG